MHRFALLLLPFLLLSCIKQTQSAEHRFCGISSAKSGTQLNTLPTCEQGMAYCPFSPQVPLTTQFCQIPYSRAPGFWFGCAPESPDPICSANICTGKPVITTPPLWDFKPDCDMVYMAYFAINGDDDYIRKTLGNNVHIGESLSGGIRYFLYEKNNIQWIVFRGSVSTCDWLADFDHELVFEPTLGMKIHHGFLFAAQSAVKLIKDKNWLDKNKIVRITGHSLGGAVATITALFLAKDDYQLDAVTTFGQPEITDKAGATTSLAKKIPLLRVINNNDVIPRAMEVLDSNFAQFGPEFRLEPDSTGKMGFVYLDHPEGTRYTENFDLYNIKKLIDHHPDSYLNAFMQMSCKFTPPK